MLGDTGLNGHMGKHHEIEEAVHQSRERLLLGKRWHQAEVQILGVVAAPNQEASQVNWAWNLEAGSLPVSFHGKKAAWTQSPLPRYVTPPSGPF